jgi:glycosyltransferase involved in cell wall biosynthesis
LKITHVATGYPFSFHGGITNYLRTLCDEQASLGDAITVIGGPDPSAAASRGLTYFEWQGNARVAGAMGLKPDAAGTTKLLHAIRSSEPDLVHFHMTLGVGVDFYDAASAHLRCPYVVSLHDYNVICPRTTLIDRNGRNCGGPAKSDCTRCVGRLDQVHLLRSASSRLGLALPLIRDGAPDRRLRGAVEFLHSAALVLAVSARTRDLHKAVSPDANFVVEHIGSRTAGALVPAKTSTGPIKATFIGYVSTHKGAPLLEDLLREAQGLDIEFHAYGRAQSNWLRRLRSAGLKYHGTYGPEDIPQIMSATDVGVALPVWEDSGPQVVMEFLNFKVPVLATRIGGIPDFVSPETGHLIEPTHAGILDAVDWLRGLSRRDFARLGSAAPKLPTPAEHAERLRRHYTRALASQDERRARQNATGGDGRSGQAECVRNTRLPGRRP